MRKLTEKQVLILRYLSICTMPATPTEIGEACGKPYHKASSWVCSGMKSLIASGLVARYDGGYYDVTTAGCAALEARSNV